MTSAGGRCAPAEDSMLRGLEPALGVKPWVKAAYHPNASIIFSPYRVPIRTTDAWSK
jgi:hypothetical protein